jgi:hypothetical protein
MFSSLHEPSEFDVREALRILIGLKGEDGLVVIDGHNDSVRYCPCRILPRYYFNAEGHPLSRAPAKHATDMEAEGARQARSKFKLRHHPVQDQLLLTEGTCDEAVMAVNSHRSRRVADLGEHRVVMGPVAEIDRGRSHFGAPNVEGHALLRKAGDLPLRNCDRDGPGIRATQRSIPGTLPRAAVRSPTRMRGNEDRWENHSNQGASIDDHGIPVSLTSGDARDVVLPAERSP